MPLDAAVRLGERFVLQEQIAVGGMGEVWRATDQRSGIDVAVKVLRPGIAAGARRFAEEIAALEILRHPNVVRLIATGTYESPSGPLPFYVMDLVEGDTLGALLEQGACPEPLVRRVGADVAAALAAAHAHGIVHRDVKPGNILIDDHRTRLADFGIARTVDMTTLTATGFAMGTASYVAPEQLEDARGVGPSADVYALGLVLFEALTGCRPFAGSAIESAVARLRRDVPVPPDLADPWPHLLQAMTRRLPADRPSAGAVAALLRAPPGSAEEARELARLPTGPSDSLTMPPTTADPLGPAASGAAPPVAARSGVTPSGIAPSGLTTSGVTPSGVTPSGMAPSGVTGSGATPVGANPSGPAASGLDVPGLAVAGSSSPVHSASGSARPAASTPQSARGPQPSSTSARRAVPTALREGHGATSDDDLGPATTAGLPEAGLAAEEHPGAGGDEETRLLAKPLAGGKPQSDAPGHVATPLPRHRRRITGPPAFDGAAHPRDPLGAPARDADGLVGLARGSTRSRGRETDASDDSNDLGAAGTDGIGRRPGWARRLAIAAALAIGAAVLLVTSGVLDVPTGEPTRLDDVATPRELPPELSEVFDRLRDDLAP